MAISGELTHERLLSVLDYDRTSGKFTWLQRISIRISVGAEAGSATADGYTEIGIDGENYLAHRLAWFYVTGEWPASQIDHHDTDKSNARWSNLREASHGQNVHNSGLRKNNTSGFKGVSYVRKLERWTSRIMVDRRLHLLGYFDTPEAAHAAYVDKAHQLVGEFARMA